MEHFDSNTSINKTESMSQNSTTLEIKPPDRTDENGPSFNTNEEKISDFFKAFDNKVANATQNVKLALKEMEK